MAAQTELLGGAEMAGENPTRRRTAAAIFLVALLLRLTLFGLAVGHPERRFSPDSYDYEILSRNLLEHGAFSTAKTPPYAPEFLRTPGYPVFLAAVHGAGGGPPAIALLQILLSAASCVLLYAAARRWAGERWAAVAGFAQALSLGGILLPQYLLTESLFHFLLTLQLWLATKYLHRDRTNSGRGMLLGAMALLAAMTYLRAIAYYWILPGCLLLLCERQATWPRRLLRAAACLGLYAALLAPWALRNRAADGAFFFTTNMGLKLYEYTVPTMESRLTGRPAAAIRTENRARAKAAFMADPKRFAPVHARDDWRNAEAMRYIRAHPLAFARMHLYPALWLPDASLFFEYLGATTGQRGTQDVMAREGLFAAARHYFADRFWLAGALLPWGVLLGLIYFGAALGIVLWIRRRAWAPLLFFAAFSGYYLLLAAPGAEPRYREPAMPMMIVAAAAGFGAATKRSGARREGKP